MDVNRFVLTRFYPDGVPIFGVVICGRLHWRANLADATTYTTVDDARRAADTIPQFHGSTPAYNANPVQVHSILSLKLIRSAMLMGPLPTSLETTNVD